MVLRCFGTPLFSCSVTAKVSPTLNGISLKRMLPDWGMAFTGILKGRGPGFEPCVATPGDRDAILRVRTLLTVKPLDRSRDQ